MTPTEIRPEKRAETRREAETGPPTGTRWLDQEEQVAWRAYLSASQMLADRLGRELQRDAGLSQADYELLVQLSEAPDRQLRMSILADRTLFSRSRLSHAVARLERMGLVTRISCPTDRRGTWASLTDEGFRRLEAAAPCHVTGVRTHLVDRLTREEFLTLGRLSARVREALEQVERDRPA
ncbi:MAG: MarR family winged helix-turn-helix transcriptional regulator [Actinomycetes bacterium]